MTHGPGPDVATVGAQHVGSPSCRASQLGDLPAGEELRAEPDRLVAGALGQPHAGDAAREAQVVADHRAGAGLAADRLGLEHDDRQPFGRAVDRRRQAGRPGADDRTGRRPRRSRNRWAAVDRDGHVADAVAAIGVRLARDQRARPARRRPALTDPGRPSSQLRRRCRPGSASPIRSRKSRIASVSESRVGEMILTVTTSGSGTVEPQSESRSVIALWNSSSRTPRGISR